MFKVTNGVEPVLWGAGFEDARRSSDRRDSRDPVGLPTGGRLPVGRMTTTKARTPGRVRSRRVREAEEMVSRVFPAHTIHLLDEERPLDMELSALRVGATTAGLLRYGSPVRLSTAGRDELEHFFVQVLLAGTATSRRGSEEPVTIQPGRAAVFSPGVPAETSLSADAELLCLMVPRARMEAELEQLVGAPLTRRLRFDLSMDLTTPLGRSWANALQILLDELDREAALAAHERTALHLEALLVEGLLLAQPHNYSDQGRAWLQAPRGAIARAVELVQERPADPWTTAALAREVHLSVRAVQEGFMRDLGMPPMAYVRQVRLQRVHADLARAVPGTTTVAAVATRWGFLHLGRFAAAHRSAFGEAPSETLARVPVE